MAVLACAARLNAQYDGPIILGKEETPENVHFDPPECKLIVNGLYTHSVIEDALSKSESRQYRFDQVWSMSTTGYLIDPSVVDMRLAGAFGLMESFISTDLASDRQIGELYEYDTGITLFRPRPLSATAYARRDRSVIDRTFGPSLESTTTTNGAALDYRSGLYTSHLELFQSTSSLRSPGDPLSDFDFTETSLLWNNRYQISDYQELTWDYVFDDADQTAFDYQSHTQRNDARIEHEWRFGVDKRNRLTSTLQLLDQTGNFEQQYVRWEERLRLQHSPQLETNYRYLLDRRTSNGLDQTRFRETASFTHRLYKSLITTGLLGAEQIASGDGPGSDEYFCSLDFDYRKKVPLGLLTAGLGFGLNRLNTTQGGSRQPVIDLPFVVPADLTPIVLIEPNLRPDSIVITDPTGLRIYRQGVDYDLVQNGERTEIRPVLGGPLTAGKIVAIDYAFDAQPANTTDTANFRFNARYTLEKGPLRGVSFFGHFYQQEQTVNSSASADFIENSFRDTLLGIEYRIGAFTFTAEEQWRTGGLYPFDARRFSAKWDQSLDFDARILVNTSYMIFDYPDADDHVELWTISGQYQQRLARDLRFTASALWRDERDTLWGNSTGFEQQVELTWKYRQFDFFVRARNSMLENEQRNNSSYQDMQIGFERRF